MNILCAWEMGANLGHLANFLPFAREALARGHDVTLAVKDIHNAPVVFKDMPIRLLQAPVLPRNPPRGREPILSYAQLVANRFSHWAELHNVVRVWDAIFDAVRPDAVIYDYAPWAMVASLDRPWRKWTIGNGFFLPSCDGPCFGMYYGAGDRKESQVIMADSDRRLLTMINRVRREQNRPAIDAASEIISQADHSLLLTLPELDHMMHRQNGDFVGLPRLFRGATPQWPDNGGRKVFAYLENFEKVEETLSQLVQRETSLVVYSRSIPGRIKDKFSPVRFATRPVDMQTVHAEADLVVSMGNHGTVASTMLAGVPQLFIPWKLEQGITATRAVEAGQGVLMYRDDANVRAKFDRVFDMLDGRWVKSEFEYENMLGPRLESRIAELMDQLQV